MTTTVGITVFSIPDHPGVVKCIAKSRVPWGMRRGGAPSLDGSESTTVQTPDGTLEVRLLKSVGILYNYQPAFRNTSNTSD